MPKVHVTFEFETEEEMRAHFGAEAQVRTVVAGADEVSVPVAQPDDQPTRDDVDADGMPYDESVHADPPSFTAKGLWRAQRGKASEADQARADWKAKGGDIKPPADLPAPVLPGLPGMSPAPAPEPEPISFDRMVEKLNGMIARQKVDSATLERLYLSASGAPSAAAAFGVFNTQESARAKLFAALCEIEPELA